MLGRFLHPRLLTISSQRVRHASSMMIHYTGILYKKFLFLVHPDYFSDTPKLQRINTENLQSLSSLLADKSQEDFDRERREQAQSPPRTLTFYCKSTEDMPMPRRVRVNVNNLHISLREILEDYEDIELPPHPSGKGHGYVHDSSLGYGYGNSNDAMKTGVFKWNQISEFLDTLIERRELMAWREARRNQLVKVQDVVQQLLGCDCIDIRYNWSAQNNAVMFQSLLDVLLSVQRGGGGQVRRQEQQQQQPWGETRTHLSQQRQRQKKVPIQPFAHTVITDFGATAANHELHLPWTGIDLVLTNDDCSSEPVDTLEGEVKLNPGHVPLQWLDVVSSVTKETVEEVRRLKEKRDQLCEAVEPALQAVVESALETTLGARGYGEDMIALVCGQVRVKLVRGHTCSKGGLMHLCQNVLAASSREDKRRRRRRTIQPEARVRATPPSSSSFPVEGDGREVAFAASLVDPDDFWLMDLPLTMSIVVEQGHGTKVLPRGDIRVDCRAPPAHLHSLLAQFSLESVRLTATTARKAQALDVLRTRMRDSLQLRDVSAGIGVSDDEFLGFLQRLDRTLALSQHQGFKGDKAKLNSALRGLRDRPVVVGRYMGFSADGSVILPVESMFSE